MSKRRYFKSDHPVTDGKDMTLDGAFNALIALFQNGKVDEAITFRLGEKERESVQDKSPTSAPAGY